MTKGYVAEQCARCNHAKGDHKSSGSLSLVVNYGVCLIEGCDCAAFSKPQGDRLNVLRHWVVTSPADPVSRLAVLSEADAKVYTDHGWTVEGPFVPEPPARAVAALREVRAMVAVLHLDAKERILDTIDAAIRGRS